MTKISFVLVQIVFKICSSLGICFIGSKFSIVNLTITLLVKYLLSLLDITVALELSNYEIKISLISRLEYIFSILFLIIFFRNFNCSTKFKST